MPEDKAVRTKELPVWPGSGWKGEQWSGGAAQGVSPSTAQFIIRRSGARRARSLLRGAGGVGCSAGSADGGGVTGGPSLGVASGVSTGCGGGKSGNGIGGPRSVLGVLGVDEAVGVAGVIGSGELGWSGVGGRWSSVAGGPASGSSGICWGRTSS